MLEGMLADSPMKSRRAKSRFSLPTSSLPRFEKGSLCSNRGVVAMTGIHPSRVRHNIKHLFLDLVKKSCEVFRRCGLSHAPREPAVAGDQVRRAARVAAERHGRIR